MEKLCLSSAHPFDKLLDTVRKNDTHYIRSEITFDERMEQCLAWRVGIWYRDKKSEATKPVCETHRFTKPPITMFAQERLRAISKVVRERRRMTFAELQAVIPASPATIRRDLGELEKSGEFIRVHGGVMAS